MLIYVKVALFAGPMGKLREAVGLGPKAAGRSQFAKEQ